MHMSGRTRHRTRHRRAPGFAETALVTGLAAVMLTAGFSPAVAAPFTQAPAQVPPPAALAEAPAAQGPVVVRSAEERARRLPVALQQAIERDLDMSPTDYLKAADAATRAAATTDALRSRLGGKVGGAWLDGGTLNVAVTDEEAGRAVRAAGGTPHLRGTTEGDLVRGQEAIGRWVLTLTAAEQRLFHAVAADVRQGRVVVRISDSDAGRALAAKVPVTDVAPVAVEFAAGAAPVAQLRGGEGILLSRSASLGAQPPAACSLGFNAVDIDGRARLLTAGHCADGGHGFVFTEAGSAPVGVVEAHVFDDLDVGGQGDDYATITVTSSALELTPEVNNYGGAAVEVHDAVAPLPGMRICKSGRTTGWTCGQIQQARIEVLSTPSDGPGRLISVLQHDACSRAGDSGGSVMAGNSAVGLTQGGVPGPTPDQCPSDAGGRNFSVSEILVDDVLGDFTGDAALTLLTTTGDADGDGVLDVDELAGDPTAERDANGDGIAAFLDPDEPNLRAPAVTAPTPGSRTTDTTADISGTGKAGAGLTVSVDGGEPMDAEVGRDGTWTVRAGELTLGSHEVTARQALGATESATATSTFSVVPEAPVISSPGDGTVSGDRRPLVTGTGRPGALVTVEVAVVDGVLAGESTVGEAGGWSVALGADLAAGRHAITATQTVSGVTSDAATVTYEVDEPDPAPGPRPPIEDNLALTGSDAIVPLTVAGLLALAAGAAAVSLSRRRRAGF